MTHHFTLSSNLQVVDLLSDELVKTQQNDVVDRSTEKKDRDASVHRGLGNCNGGFADLFGLSQKDALGTGLARVKRISLSNSQ